MPAHVILMADRIHHIPVSPYVVGAAIFAFFCVLMIALLLFGKGRPHS